MANSLKRPRFREGKANTGGFAQRLRALRMDVKNNNAHAITQENAAKKLSNMLYGNENVISSRRMSFWENGDKEPELKVVIGLARLYGTTCDYLLTGVEPDRVDASRRYGLSNDALAMLEDLNYRLDIYLEIVEKDKYPYIRPVAFINTLLASEKLRAIAVDAIKLTYDRMLHEMREANAAKKPEETESWEERVRRNWQDEEAIKAIFETNPHYSNKRIVDSRDYSVSKEYELNKRWSALLDEIASNPSLTPNGVIHSNRLERSWVGIPDASDEGGNENGHQKK